MPPPGSHIFIYWFILKDHLFSLLNHLSVLPYQARAQFKHLPLCKVPWTIKIPALQPLTTCASCASVKTQRTKLHFKLIRTENKQLTRYLDNKQKDDFGNSSEYSFKFRQEEVCKQR